MPFPPGRPPVAGEGDSEHRLGEEHERDDDGEREWPRPVPIEAEVAPDAEAVGDEADDGDRGKWAACVLGRDGVVERRQRGQRDDGPRRHVNSEESVEGETVADEKRRGLGVKADRGGRREEAGLEEPDRRRDLEAGVLPGQKDSRSRERVQHEVARRREERHPDEEQARILAPRRRLCEQQAERE